MSNLQTIPIASIDITGRLRGADPAQIEALKASIIDVGLLNPITVNETGGVHAYRLVAGLHRLEAYRAMSHTDIPAIILELNDLEAILAECDENLCAPQLTPTDRATFTAKRKAAYEALHPETAKDAFKGNQHVVADNLSVASFATETAKATGRDERTVRRDAERGSKLFPEAAECIRGTKLDTGTYIDRIKNLSPSEQMRAVERDLAYERKKEREAKPKKKAKAATGGVGGRYQQAEPRAFETFVAMAEAIMSLTPEKLIESAGREHVKLRHLARSLAAHMDKVTEGLDA